MTRQASPPEPRPANAKFRKKLNAKEKEPPRALDGWNTVINLPPNRIVWITQYSKFIGLCVSIFYY